MTSIEKGRGVCPDFSLVTCCALVYGKRCGRFRAAHPCIWRSSPTSGDSTQGPRVVLCRMHANKYERNRPARLRIVNGWLGPYNEHNYGSSEWSRERGWTPAARWWRHRSEARFGEDRRDAL